MFTRSFSVGKNHALRRAVSLVLVLGLIAGALSLAGCKAEDDTGNLVGYWQNIYAEGTDSEFITNIRITATTVEYEGSYKATIENEPGFEAAYGVLIIKFTEYLAHDYSNYPEVTTSPDPTKVDKYAALYWKDLTASTVNLADAYIGSDHQIVDDLETARSTFTNDNAHNFVDWSGVSPYNKK
jgi:hypothetical protein